MTIYMSGCGTILLTGQFSPDICYRLAKNAKWSQNVSTKEGPVLSGPGLATATRHSTKNIWNWSVKNPVNCVELYICIHLKTNAFIEIRMGHKVLFESILADYFASIKLIENTKIEDDCLCRLDPYTGSCFWKHFLLLSTNQELEPCYWRTQIFAELLTKHVQCSTFLFDEVPLSLVEREN